MDSEEMVGMFGAAQKRAPNATLCFLSCRMKAVKNRTVKYLDDMSEERRNDVLHKAVPYGRKATIERRKKVKDFKGNLQKDSRRRNRKKIRRKGKNWKKL